jgi:hypothetical protein
VAPCPNCDNEAASLRSATRKRRSSKSISGEARKKVRIGKENIHWFALLLWGRLFPVVFPYSTFIILLFFFSPFRSFSVASHLCLLSSPSPSPPPGGPPFSFQCYCSSFLWSGTTCPPLHQDSERGRSHIKHATGFRKSHLCRARNVYSRWISLALCRFPTCCEVYWIVYNLISHVPTDFRYKYDSFLWECRSRVDNTARILRIA